MENETKVMPTDRHIDYDTYKGYRISTVALHTFAAFDYLYETMVFYGDSFSDLICEKYKTVEEAKKGHENILLDVIIRVDNGEKI